MTRKILRRLLPPLAVLLGTAAYVGAVFGQTLTERRAERRATLRNAYAAPDKSGPLFQLLVIPVDFADHRLHDDWDAARDLAPRVSGLAAETLERYFSVASGRDDVLRVTLAPLVNLVEESSYYSDRYSPQSVERTRALAAESLAGADAAGLDFGTADADGDGCVDGVLILHAAPGLENDPVDGWVVPLQYFLEAPYRQGAYEAQSYAVASLRSGPGVWCHETGHLLGLEDRYDTYLSTSGDSALSRGGLGAASLMAAGAWGRGDGTGAALPDAYSLLELGWAEAVDLSSGLTGTLELARGQVLRVPVEPDDTGESFLVRLRGGDTAWPYDAVYPDARLELLHVDTSVPDDAHSDDETAHLRVRLVEADGDCDVEEGDTVGDAGDLFDLDAVFGPETDPSSDAYAGASGVSLSFSAGEDGITVTYSLTGDPFTLDLRFVADDDDLLCVPTLYADGEVDGTISIRATRLDDAFGSFAGGVSFVDRVMVADANGLRSPESEIVWESDGSPEAGDATDFSFAVFMDGIQVGVHDRTWIWSGAEDPFPIEAPFSAGWSRTSENDDTRWFAWDGADATGLPDIPLLACTAAAHADGADWPDVLYANGDDARLISPPFVPEEGQVLRLIHAVDLDADTPDAGDDGALVSYRTPDGSYHALTPDGGYPGRVNGAATNPLHGRDVFLGPGDLDAGDAPVWRVDTFAFPEDLTGGTHLEFRLASDPLWRGRGWLIAGVDLADAGSAFTATYDEARGGMVLCWPWETPEHVYLDLSPDNGLTWNAVWDEDLSAGQDASDLLIPETELALSAYAADDNVRIRGRIRLDVGDVVTHSARVGTMIEPPALSLGVPRPVPSRGDVAMEVVNEALGARLSAYDLRGRRVRNWWLPRGTYLLTWDGRDDEGRRLPAGTYLLRLSIPGGALTATRKVCLLR